MEIRLADADAGSHLDAEMGEVAMLGYRLIVAPAEGTVVLPAEEERPSPGEFLLPGDAVAIVLPRRGPGLAARVSFAGWAVGYVVRDRQPVEAGQPVAWMRGASA